MLVPQEQFQIVELARQILLDLHGNASVREPVAVGFQRPVTCQKRDTIFESSPTVPESTVVMLVLLQNA